MPTHDPSLRLELDDAAAVVAEATFPCHTAPRPDRIGLEIELFPIRVDDQGRPAGRLPLTDTTTASVLSMVDGIAARDSLLLPREPDALVPTVPVAAGGALTFEPGGQIEFSGQCRDTVSEALCAADGITQHLAAGFGEAGVALVAAGVDLWHDVNQIPQQLRAPRYPAMAAYFDARGPAGRFMMRHTCALQVNLDMGGAAETTERWLVANLAAPLLVATFAASPGLDPPTASRRSANWQEVDPTRTGFPRRLVTDRDVPDPVTATLDAALEACVLLVRGAAGAVPGVPGRRFVDWLRDGHPTHGWPTADDLCYHLTTLFHEVRPRGVLELRAIDALPAPWRPVPVVLLAGMVYDPRARAAVRELLEPSRHRLPEMLRLSATIGIADRELRELAVATWTCALEGARRLPSGYVSEEHLQRTEDFLDRHTMRGRCPADDLRDLFRADPAAALAAMSEPAANIAAELETA